MIDTKRALIANRPINTQEVDDMLCKQAASHLFHPMVAPRIQQMLDYLIANQALICQYSYGHIELHFKGEQVQAVMKHPLSI